MILLRLTPDDFTQSLAGPFHSVSCQMILLHLTPYDFTPSKRDPLGVKGLKKSTTYQYPVLLLY